LQACAAFLAVFLIVFFLGKVWSVIFDRIVVPLAKLLGFKNLESIDTKQKVLFVGDHPAMKEKPASSVELAPSKSAEQKKME
jgi:hypothetical protein